MQVHALALGLLAAAVALAGCSHNEDEDDHRGHPTGATHPTNGTPTHPSTPTSPPPTPATPTSPTPSAPRGPVTWEVEIRANDFVNGSLTIQRGDTVTWLHRDGTVLHTVTADDGAFHSGDCPGLDCMVEVAGRDTFSHTFEESGSFPYHCQVHPSMTDTITVLPRHDAVP